MTPFDEYRKILEKFDAENRLRNIPQDRTDLPGIDLTSNDYMGLGARWKEYRDEFFLKFPHASFSSSASRLLSQRQDAHVHLENLLAGLYRKESLLFNSGYHANVGIIQALAIPGTIFLCDKLIHASMIDGVMLAKADYQRWRHNDLSSLRKLLDKYKSMERCVVMLESVYSMDGDTAPLRELADLKKEYHNVILYVDEAHAFGTRGRFGLGLGEETGVIDEIDIIVGTLGKAAASAGAFVSTHELLKSYFLNSSRSFIFSTALPPVNAAWSEHMILKLLTMDKEREHLIEISDKFRSGIEEITGQPNNSRSHIVPLIVGDAHKAMLTASKLSLKGIDALPIRRPTVPQGGERIRFSLSAEMTEDTIEYILKTLKEVI